MSENKEVTALVKAVRKSLKDEHGVNVPHAALRASVLAAIGENPHAFAKKATKAAKAPVPTPAVAKVKGPWVKLTLMACEREDDSWTLSFEDEDTHVVPAGFDLSAAIVVECWLDDGQDAQEQEKRLRALGLQVSPNVKFAAPEFDFCDVTLLMPQALFTELAHAVMKAEDLEDDVAGYLAEQHMMFWHQEDRDEQAVWFLRYMGLDEDIFWSPDEVSAEEVAAAQPLPAPEALPASLRHVKALTWEAFEEAARKPRGAFERETVNTDTPALLYLDKQPGEQDISQDVWFQYNKARNTVTYVLRVVDHPAGQALQESECELTMARAALLLDESIEQQLGLQALRIERERLQARRWD